MSTGNIRSLLEQLTGDLVTVIFEDEERTGRVAAITDDLLVLSVRNRDVLWVDINDITAVRVVGERYHGNDDDE
ncbi:MAG: hypothetical protein DIU70_010790 [Bacillota bacterium]|nr:MAG: hypothetical protein DIU70_08045 [Bacillota bacterium]